MECPSESNAGWTADQHPGEPNQLTTRGSLLIPFCLNIKMFSNHVDKNVIPAAEDKPQI